MRGEELSGGTGEGSDKRLGEQSGPLGRGRDLLGLVTDRLADSVKDAWDYLLQEAVHDESARIVARLSTGGQSSSLQRVIFDSLRCPPELQRSSGTDAEASAEVLEHIRLLRLCL